MEIESGANNSIRAELGFLAAPLEGVGIHPDVERRRRSAVGEYMMRRHAAHRQVPLVVVVGLTGTGVSTVVNALCGVDVAATGVLRPTTTSPLIVVTADNLDAPVTGLAVAMDGAPRVVEMASVPFTIIDAPAWEMGVGGEVSARLLPLADVVVCVTTPARYADAGVWRLIEAARDAEVAVVIVMNMPTDGPLDDLKGRMALRYGALAPPVVAGIASDDLVAAITVAASSHRVHSIDGARLRLREVLKTMEPIIEEAAALLETARIIYADHSRALEDRLKAGEFVPAAESQTLTDASFSLASVITSRIGAAAEQTATAWAATQLGEAALVSETVGLWRHGPDVSALAQRHVAETIGDIRMVVRDMTKWRRPSERKLSLASDYLWRTALGRDVANWTIKRGFGKRRARAVDRVRSLFSEAVTQVFSADRQRFVDRLHHIPTAARLWSLHESFEDRPDLVRDRGESEFSISIDLTDGSDILVDDHENTPASVHAKGADA